jgi:hypothetical protein
LVWDKKETCVLGFTGISIYSGATVSCTSVKMASRNSPQPLMVTALSMGELEISP